MARTTQEQRTLVTHHCHKHTSRSHIRRETSKTGRSVLLPHAGKTTTRSEAKQTQVESLKQMLQVEQDVRRDETAQRLTIVANTQIAHTFAVERAKLISVVATRGLILNVVKELGTTDDDVEVARVDELLFESVTL